MLTEVRSRPVDHVRRSTAQSRPAPTPSPAPRPRVTPKADSFGVGTYNLAGGNATYGTAEKFESTKRLAAQQIVSGEVSVMALQEVGVNGRNTTGRDNNEQILEEVFRQELPRNFRGADIDKVSLDANGRPIIDDGKPVYDPMRYADTRYTATNQGGETQHMTLTRERYDRQGRELPFTASAKDGPTVLYSARLEEENKSYSLAFSANNDAGNYGNSVLLAPGYEVENVQQKVLGHDYNDHEQRSALAVTFTTPEGQESTAISAHLSNGSSQKEGDSRLPQLQELSRFADGFDNALVMGDYNTHPGKEYGKKWLDFLPFIEADKTPSASDLGFVDPDRGGRSIDRIFTNGDVSVSGREDQGRGGSDHPLVTWDVTL